MTQAIRDHVTAYCKSKNYETSDDNLFEIIREHGKWVFSEIIGTHRWYEDEFVVVNFQGMLIGYNDIHTTGDHGRSDMDIDWDLNSICEVEPKEIITTIYVKK